MPHPRCPGPILRGLEIRNREGRPELCKRTLAACSTRFSYIAPLSEREAFEAMNGNLDSPLPFLVWRGLLLTLTTY